MRRFWIGTCALWLAASGCNLFDMDGDDDEDDESGALGSAGSSGGAGSDAPTPNMPDAECVAAAGADDSGCVECACTPNAMGGCLAELTACVSSDDERANELCSGIIDCARANDCSGQDCISPCMSELTPAFSYMGGAPLDSATAVDDCTSANCSAVCP